MERYQGKICILATQLIEDPDNPKGFISLANYKQLCHRGHINVTRRACYGTPALVDFDTLPLRYRQLYITSFGDPYKIMQDNFIATHIERDANAYSFYKNYRLDNGKSLPEERIEEYITNAEILSAIHKIVNNRRAMRKALSGSTHGIWENIAQAVADMDKEKYPHSLPTNHVRLREKVRSFINDGYESLIHKGYCNKNTEKVNEDAKLWLLARWANMVERVTSVEHLFFLYNKEAKVKGWKQIESVTTIRNYLYQEDVQELWHGYRYGESKSKEKFALQHSTRMPSMRDSLWYSDGTKLNLFYITDENKIETISVYEVMDAYSETLLGYHISKTEDYEAQYNAYKMAVQFAGHRPYQTTYDNQGGHKKLEAANFLNKVAHLSIKTQPYNGKSKTIESAFGRFQAQILKQHWFFTGQNITARAQESRANMEFILANKANLPTLQEVKDYYRDARNDWNNAPHSKTGTPRVEMYRNSYNPKSVPVTLLDMVDMFWLERPEPITLTAYGLSFTERKAKYDYLVYLEDGMPDQKWLRKNIDKKFVVKFDPDDMSMVMLYERDTTGLRFVKEAKVKVTVSRGKQEQEDWENSYITQVNNTNKILRTESMSEMDRILEIHDLLPEQHGLRSPGVRGMKKAAASDFGRATKAVSNAVPAIEGDDDDNIYNLM